MSNGTEILGGTAGHSNATAKAGMPGLDEFREAFYAFDRNHDGQLELDELLAVCRALKVDS